MDPSLVHQLVEGRASMNQMQLNGSLLDLQFSTSCAAWQCTFFYDCKRIMKDLQEKFSQGNVLQQGMSVSTYCTKLKSIWDELIHLSHLEVVVPQRHLLQKEKKEESAPIFNGFKQKFPNLEYGSLLWAPWLSKMVRQRKEFNKTKNSQQCAAHGIQEWIMRWPLLFRATRVLVAATKITSNLNITLWYPRLGHLSFDRLSLLKELVFFFIKVL